MPPKGKRAAAAAPVSLQPPAAKKAKKPNTATTATADTKTEVKAEQKADVTKLGAPLPKWFISGGGIWGTAVIFTPATSASISEADIKKSKNHTLIPGTYADSKSVTKPLLMITDGKTTRQIKVKEWIAAKEKFITDVRAAGYSPEVCKEVRKEVLGRPADVAEYSSYFTPPASAGSGTEGRNKLVMAVWGTQAKPESAPKLNELAQDCLPTGWRWLECTRSGRICFGYAWRCLIRTSVDYLRAAYAAHNITCAAVFMANTRATLWTEMHLPYGTGSKLLTPGWSPDMWERMTEANRSRPLADTDMSASRAQEGTVRLREHLRNKIDMYKADIDLILAEGYNRFVTEQKRVDWESEWPECAVWLALVCGARKVEILSLGSFDAISMSQLKEMQLPIADYQAGAEKYIEQKGIAKKKDGSLAVIPENAQGLFRVQKPLLSEITVAEFLPLMEIFRRAVKAYVATRTDVPFESLQRDNMSALCDQKLRKAFSKVWGGFQQVQEEVETVSKQKKFTFHLLRAIYGKLSHYNHARSRMDLTVWLSSRLGHDITDIHTALYYTVINLVPPPEIKAKDYQAELETLMATAKAKVAELSAILPPAQARLPDVLDPVEVADGVQLIPLGRNHTREQRKAKAQDLLDQLKAAGIAPTNKILRDLSFGSRAIQAVLANSTF